MNTITKRTHQLLFFFFFLTQCALAQQDYKAYLKLSYAEIDSLMNIEYAKGAYKQAVPLMQAGREKAKVEFGEQDSVFAEYTNNLGFFYEKTGEYEKALPLYIQVKNVDEKVLGAEHPDFTLSLNNLANLHQTMGNYEKALPLYIQAKDFCEKVLGMEHPNFAQSLNNLAVLHYIMGQYEKALPLFIQAKKIFEKVLGVEHPDYAQSLNNLALLHKAMGQYEKALPLSIQAKNIYEKVLGAEHPDFTLSLNNLAYLYQAMGQYEKALPLSIQAKKIYEKVLGAEHSSFATSLNNLASLHYAMGNYEKALPLSIQAKNIYEKVLGAEHPDFASSLNNLATLHIEMRNYEKAWTTLLEAIEVSSSLKLSQNISEAWADSLLQAPYTSNLHLKKMLGSLRITYNLLEKEGESANTSKAKQNIISALALELLDKLLQQTSLEKDKLRILKQSSRWVDRSLRVLDADKQRSRAFNLADQNKSVLLFQATKSEAAYKLGNLPDSLVRSDKKMRKKQSILQAKLVEKRSKAEKDSLRNELNNINLNIDAFVRMLEKDYPKYYQLKHQQINTKVEDIQALLDDKTVLIEYLISDSLIHLFKVDKNEVFWHSQALDKEELEENIKSLHQALSDYELIVKEKKKAYKNYSDKAYWFYQNLLEPVLKEAAGIENVVIVTDGALGYLPFETFLVEQAPQSITDYNELHYLVNDYSISYNYSATLWKENKEAPSAQNNGQILGLAANYEIPLDSSMIGVRLPTDQWLRAELMPLPAARREVEALQENYQGFFAFDSLASEKTVKAKAADYAVLHFATHGILNSKRPILSSLALTEDSDSLESNFWQAHEISKMELKADLVVLSACETGYGKFETGNGIASLARSFMYAGASSLIVSLWQVNDYATADIMKKLYANLTVGMHKDEALRQAKLQYLKAAKGIAQHPAFWSPFIMMGKTDSVTLKTKGNMPWGIVGGLALLLVGFGGLLIVRRRKKEQS